MFNINLVFHTVWPGAIFNKLPLYNKTIVYNRNRKGLALYRSVDVLNIHCGSPFQVIQQIMKSKEMRKGPSSCLHWSVG